MEEIITDMRRIISNARRKRRREGGGENRVALAPPLLQSSSSSSIHLHLVLLSVMVLASIVSVGEAFLLRNGGGRSVSVISQGERIREERRRTSPLRLRAAQGSSGKGGERDGYRPKGGRTDGRKAGGSGSGDARGEGGGGKGGGRSWRDDDKKGRGPNNRFSGSSTTGGQGREGGGGGGGGGSSRGGYSREEKEKDAEAFKDSRGQGLRKALAALAGPRRSTLPSSSSSSSDDPGHSPPPPSSSSSSPPRSSKPSSSSRSTAAATTGGPSNTYGDTRLNKMLAHAGVVSRRGADDLISQGKVTVNGQIIREVGTKVDPRRDQVAVNGKAVSLRPAQEISWMMINKPKGALTSVNDERGRKTVADLVPMAKERRLLPVGRLDRDSAGLLLMTNDNEAINLLTHPSFEHVKVYKIVVEKGMPAAHTLSELAKGVLLEGETTRLLPMSVQPLDYFADRREAVLEVTVKEGRNRMLRRAFEQLGHPIKSLTRIAFGSLRLGDLKPGQSRRLSLTEMAKLKTALSHYRKKLNRKLNRRTSAAGEGEGKEEGKRKKGGRAGRREEGGEEVDPEIEAFWDAVDLEEDQEEDGVWLGD